MKKTLIYHLYACEDISSNVANRLHHNCLEKYCDVFDDARFTIAVDDLTDYEVISSAIRWCSSIGFKGDLRYTVVKNTDLREVPTFDREILKNSDNLDGMVFFAHNKGSTNMVSKDGVGDMNIVKWVCSLYFYNLQFVDEVEGYFTGKLRAPEVFYGTMLMYFTKDRTNWVHAMPNNLSGLEYAGTFYWINMPKYRNCKKMGIIKDVEPDSRFFAEEYPGMFFERYAYGCGMTSHNDAILDAIQHNPYNCNWDEIQDILGEKEEFNKFLEEVW